MKKVRALISCYDKSGLRDFVSELIKLNPEIKIFSSNGTFKELKQIAENKLVKISDYTGFREMPSGLVKTLHPKIHSGILADLNDEAQKTYLDENAIEAFDLVVVNLYPFEKAVAEGKDFQEIRNNIDVGGVSLIEAAAKNFLRVAVIADPRDYALIIKRLNEKGCIDTETRLLLAKKALAHLHNYIGEISSYFSKLEADDVK